MEGDKRPAMNASHASPSRKPGVPSAKQMSTAQASKKKLILKKADIKFKQQYLASVFEHRDQQHGSSPQRDADADQQAIPYRHKSNTKLKIKAKHWPDAQPPRPTTDQLEE